MLTFATKLLLFNYPTKTNGSKALAHTLATRLSLLNHNILIPSLQQPVDGFVIRLKLAPYNSPIHLMLLLAHIFANDH